MRLTISLLSISLLACGGNSNHGTSPDAAVDSPMQQGGTTLTINMYQASGPTNTQLVAVQDGDGPWTVLTGNAGVYTTKLQSDRYGLMTDCVFGMFSGPNLWYAAVSDATTIYLDACSDPGPTSANISGAITGAATGDTTRVLDAYFGQADMMAGATTYQLSTLAGPQRLFAEDLASMRPVKLATADTTVTDGATVNFDFAAGFAPVTQALTATGTIAGASLSYRDAHGIAIIDRPGTAFTTFRAIPADKLGMGLNRLSVSDTNGNSVIRYFKTPADQHVTLPALFTLATQPTASRTPYPNVHFVVPVQAGTLYDLSFSTTNTGTNAGRGFSIEMTPAWIGKKYPGGAPIDYTAPDFTALAGWMTAYQPEAGIALDWSVTPSKNTNVDWFVSVPPGTMFDHDGSELAFSSLSGQLPAP